MSEDLAADLAARLRDTHRLIAASGLSQHEKGTATRRLLALSDTAKSDLARAAQRLDRLLLDLAQGRATPGEGAEGAPPA